LQPLRIILAMVAGHFGKRVLESLYVHIFSRPTLPLKQAFLNCTHYWLLFGGLVSTELCHYYNPPAISNKQLNLWLGLFTVIHHYQFFNG